MKKGIVLLLSAIILISSAQVIFADTPAYYASYVQEPHLMFEKGKSPYNSNQLVALLGTMTVMISNPPISLKEPSLVNTDSSTSFDFTGPIDENPDNQNTTWEIKPTEFYLDTVTYVNGDQPIIKRQSRTDGVATLTESTKIHNVNSFLVKIYLRAHHDAKIYKPEGDFFLTKGTIGTFNFAVAPEGANIDTTKVYVPINGQLIVDPTTPPAIPIPIVGTGGGTSTLPTVPVVDPENPPQFLEYLLSIIEERSISLPDGYGQNQTKVAKAKIDLLHAIAGKKYKVNIQFNSNSVSQGKFHLHLDGNLTRYGIPYHLYFKQDLVIPGQNIQWGNIQSGQANEKTIKVTGIIQDDAESAPSGTYRDTITVTITPIDSI